MSVINLNYTITVGVGELGLGADTFGYMSPELAILYQVPPFGEISGTGSVTVLGALSVPEVGMVVLQCEGQVTEEEVLQLSVTFGNVTLDAAAADVLYGAGQFALTWDDVSLDWETGEILSLSNSGSPTPPGPTPPPSLGVTRVLGPASLWMPSPRPGLEFYVGSATAEMELYARFPEGTEIDWGDGTVEMVPSEEDVIVHTYSSLPDGVTGKVFVSDSVLKTEEPMHLGGPALSAVIEWGGEPIEWITLSEIGLGRRSVRLGSVPSSAPKRIVSGRHMFSGAEAFDQDLNSWEMGEVIDTSYMFYDANNFNGQIGNWDVAKVTDMSGMFASQEFNRGAFNQDIGNWNTSNVTDMREMFWNAIDFNQGLNSWNVSKVVNMSSMFERATSFNRDLNSWDTSNVVIMDRMFTWADSFNGDISSWDVSNVASFVAMFAQNASFNCPLGSWDTSSAVSMAYMFHGAEAFNQDVSDWDVRNVEHFSGMFRDASVFNQDLSTWCVEHYGAVPLNFSVGADAWVLPKPLWGQPCQ